MRFSFAAALAITSLIMHIHFGGKQLHVVGFKTSAITSILIMHIHFSGKQLHVVGFKNLLFLDRYKTPTGWYSGAGTEPGPTPISSGPDRPPAPVRGQQLGIPLHDSGRGAVGLRAAL